MRFYFIGGLGSNENHITEFAHCFPYPITYLDPYKVKLESANHLVDCFKAHVDTNETTCIIASELGDTDKPSQAAIKAIQSSYRWNPELHHYELDLDPQAVLFLLRVRRELRSFQAPLTDTKALFIGPKYEDEPDWRTRALENLDPSIKKVLLKDLGHDFYTAVPNLVSKEIINWLQICS